MEDLVIRPMEPIEAERVIDVWRRSRQAAQPWLEERMQHSPEDDAAFFHQTLMREYELWVADVGGLVVGMMAVADALVGQLFIDPDWQGRGAGSALLNKAKEMFPAGVRLFTLQRNSRAQEFYDKHGFVVTQRGISPAPESEPDLLYEWRPESPPREDP